MPRKYRLQSSGMVWAPGVIRWAKNGYAFNHDQGAMINVVRSCWSGLTERAATLLLSGDVPFTENKDGDVIFTVEDEDGHPEVPVPESTVQRTDGSAGQPIPSPVHETERCSDPEGIRH